MAGQRIEFELTGDARDGVACQQQSYKWPWPPVRHYDQVKCEMQYGAFRDAYNRFEHSREIADGIYGSPRLTDAELRMRWLDYYREFVDPTLHQITAYAREVSCGAAAPGPRTETLRWMAILMLVAVFLLLIR